MKAFEYMVSVLTDYKIHNQTKSWMQCAYQMKDMCLKLSYNLMSK